MSDLRNVAEIINNHTCNRDLVASIVEEIRNNEELPDTPTKEALVDSIIEWSTEAICYMEDTPDTWLAVAVRILAGSPTSYPATDTEEWLKHIRETTKDD